MWIAIDTSNYNNDYPTVRMFEEKPSFIDGQWVVMYEDGVRVKELGYPVPFALSHLFNGDYRSCKEVTVLPQPTQDNVITDPVYKSIFDYGKVTGVHEYKNKVGEILKIWQRCDNCANNGHPYCMQGIVCEDYEFELLNYVGSKG